MKASRVGINAACILAMLAAPATAHHSQSEYDFSKRITVSGTVTQWEWTNPHAFLTLEVQGDPGSPKSQQYRIELEPPHLIQNGGWKRDSVKVGDRITAQKLAPLKRPDATARIQSAAMTPSTVVLLPDGRKLLGVPKQSVLTPGH